MSKRFDLKQLERLQREGKIKGYTFMKNTKKPKPGKPQVLFEGMDPAKEKKPRSIEESRLQSYCVEKFRQIYPEYARNFFAIPNGGKRDKVTAAIMKREGAMRGTWDTFLSVVKPPYAGLWIEFKTKEGVLSDDQEEFQKVHEAQGYKCVVVRSAEAFFFEVENYLQTNKIKSWRSKLK